MVQGNNIIISRHNGSTWQPFAATKSNTFEVGAETIEISSPTTGEWKDYIAGRKSWSFTVNFLILNENHLLDSLGAPGTKLLVCIHDTSWNSSLQGYAIIKNCKVTGTRGNLAQGAFSFVGCSTLVRT